MANTQISKPIKKQKPQDFFDTFAPRVTRWVGSGASLLTHTIFFALCFLYGIVSHDFDHMFLFLTTIVSLEAIYLSILIQSTVNRNTEDLVQVSQDIDEIQEDVDEIQEDIDEIQEDVDEIQEDVDEIQEDIDEIQEDVDEIEEGETVDQKRHGEIQIAMDKIREHLDALAHELEKAKQHENQRNSK